VVLGQATVRSEITWASDVLTYGVLHLSDHSVIGGVRQSQGPEAYRLLEGEFVQALDRGGMADLVRLVEKNFGSGTYTLRLLFRDEQRKILGILLKEAMSEAQVLYRRFYQEHTQLVRYVTDSGVALPKRFQMAVDFTLNSDLLDAFSGDEVDVGRAREILEQVRRTGVALDTVTLEFALRQTIERSFHRFLADPVKPGLLARVDSNIDLVSELPFEVRLWETQNVHYNVMQDRAREIRERAQKGDGEARAWLDQFVALGAKLKIRVEFDVSSGNE
jgi:Domain of unknown function (DUF3536)